MKQIIHLINFNYIYIHDFFKSTQLKSEIKMLSDYSLYRARQLHVFTQLRRIAELALAVLLVATVGKRQGVLMIRASGAVGKVCFRWLK